MHDDAGHWIQTEWDTADVGDLRLTKRMKSIITSFCAAPSASIPEAAGDWAKTKAVYRFLNNEKVTPEVILKPHHEATAARMEGHKVILAVQDTTYLTYTHRAEGLGMIGETPALAGMLVHTTLAFTPVGIPLGLIDQQTWVRPFEEYGKRQGRRDRPLEKKESEKWRRSLKATETYGKDMPVCCLISVGDREADIYDLFATQPSCHLLVRAAWNRRVDHPERYLWQHMEAQSIAGYLDVEVPRTKDRSARLAHMEVRYASVNIRPPRWRRGLPSVPLSVVYIHEVSLEKDALSWMLLTTLRVDSVDDATTVVRYYARRFSIEVFHKILKGGCRIEARQLRTFEGLQASLALYSIVAWRIIFLTMLGRRSLLSPLHRTL
jgi:Transposase DNA-binding/Transposase DDE domain